MKNELIKIMREHADSEKALPMKKYMRNMFEYLGIKKPERATLLKEYFQKTGMLKENFDKNFVLHLWEQPEREFQYCAVDYLLKFRQKLIKEDLKLVEYLLITKSWWDSVDCLVNVVCAMVDNYPELIEESINDWNVGDNIWLRRMSILFQLHKKYTTDERLLFRYILNNKEEKEFFIQKAIGWSLREYSKTNADSVRTFLAENQLSKLAVREASKYI